ncbi:MAG: hypothetical protein AB7N76_02040 [Planctomycetota bacterium]
MSDERLRELERAWSTAEDPDLELAYVQALVRAGLPQPRLLLAAYLGSEGALGLLGDLGFPEEPNLSAWVAGLGKGRVARSADLAREAALRAALAALDVARAHGVRLAQLDEVARSAQAWLQPAERPGHQAALRVFTGPRQGPTPAERVSLDLARVITAREVSAAANAASRAVRGLATLSGGSKKAVHAEMRAAIRRRLLVWTLRSEL